MNNRPKGKLDHTQFFDETPRKWDTIQPRDKRVPVGSSARWDKHIGRWVVGKLTAEYDYEF